MSARIAVVGCGSWGKNLVRNFAELGALHTICDTSRETLDLLAGQYPDVNTETDFAAVLANREVDGVVIATPAELHYPMATEALLSARRGVFVEKPLALRVEEGEELAALAEERGKTLLVGHLMEYHPAISRLCQLVDAGEIGSIRYITSSRLNLGKLRTRENVLWSFAPHDLSIVLRLLGGRMPGRVSAHGGSYLQPNIADFVVADLCYPDGTRACLSLSWLHPFKEQKLAVVGDRSMAVLDNSPGGASLVVYRHGIHWQGETPTAIPGKAETVPFLEEEPLRIECTDFLECLETGRRPLVDGPRGLQVLRILSACQQSLEQGGEPVTVDERDKGYFVHETSIVEEPVQIGPGTKIWHFSHVMPGVSIGPGCVIGQNVFIGRGVAIGANVKLENNVSVFEGVTLEDDVFCGPSSVFTNVTSPRSHVDRKSEFRPTLVRKGATIGANATVLCGHTIGRYAFVGAGSVVTHDVPDHALVYGNPARLHGWVCQCGERLPKASGGYARCSRCGTSYREDALRSVGAQHPE